MMKAVLSSLLVLVLSQAALAFGPKANLQGTGVETLPVRQSDGHTSATMVASASFKEIGRTESTDFVDISFLSNTEKADYGTCLYEMNTATISLDLNQMSARGESSEIAAKLVLFGMDDDIRKANGTCLLSLDQTLLCTFKPYSAVYGFNPDTEITLNLK